MSNQKIHMQDFSQKHEGVLQNAGVCGRYQDAPFITQDQLKVTCRSCLRLAGNKTPYSKPKDTLVDLVVTSTGVNFINFIKAVRELPKILSFDFNSADFPHELVVNLRGAPIGSRSPGHYFGLLESKNFGDAVRAGSHEKLLSSVSLSIATRVRLHLESIGAQVSVTDSTCVKLQTTQPSFIEQAYNEMLALFVTDEAHKKILLESTTPPDYIISNRPASLGDVQRWIKAGEMK